MNGHLGTKRWGKTTNIEWEPCIVVYLVHGDVFFSRSWRFRVWLKDVEIILSQTNEEDEIQVRLKCLSLKAPRFPAGMSTTSH